MFEPTVNSLSFPFNLEEIRYVCGSILGVRCVSENSRVFFVLFFLLRQGSGSRGEKPAASIDVVVDR